MCKFGIEHHEISFIHECHFDELNYWERYYQDLYDVCGPNGLNCRLTGTHEKVGYIIEQSRLNMRTGQAKRIRSDDEIEYLRNRWIMINKARAGRKVSEETLKRMSEAVKGTTCEKRQGFNHFNSKVVMNSVTGIFYGSAKHAADAHGYNYATLKDKLSGRRNIKNNTNLSYV
ncbi:MAG: hypothetical protein EOO20_03775 [Chryseobacterium sp.]|nr:MAG: hypothetical protein EOO20_03775 [Chryseobacterium sp.]